ALYLYRRSIRAALVGVAVAAGLAVLAPAQPPGRSVVVAATELAAGRVLGPGDLAVVRYPPDRVPDGSYAQPDDLVGRTLAAAVRKAEPMTDVRISGAAALAGSSGLVEVAVRLADAGAAVLVRPGDLVDVLAAASQPSYDGLGPDPSSAPSSDGSAQTDPGLAEVVATQARVLAVPTAPDPGGGSEGALVVLAVTPTTARVLAAAEATARLSVLIRPGTTRP
ncbi:MAG: Flp pilus assembly protein CpaB, partial [Actinomycetes bacterium]